MSTVKHDRPLASTREARILGCAKSGFLVLLGNGHGYAEEPYAAATTIDEALRKVREVLAPAEASPQEQDRVYVNVATDPNQNAGREYPSATIIIGRGNTAFRAAYDTILRLTVGQIGNPDHEHDYGFMDEEAARVALDMVRKVGGQVEVWKSREHPSTIDPDFAEVPETGGDAKAEPYAEPATLESMGDTRWMLVIGKDARAVKTRMIVCNKDQAEAMAAVARAVGGVGYVEPIREI